VLSSSGGPEEDWQQIILMECNPGLNGLATDALPQGNAADVAVEIFPYLRSSKAGRSTATSAW